MNIDIKQIRNKLGLTQIKLAEIMETNQETISRWEIRFKEEPTKKLDISCYNLKLLASKYNLDLNALFENKIIEKTNLKYDNNNQIIKALNIPSDNYIVVPVEEKHSNMEVGDLLLVNTKQSSLITYVAKYYLVTLEDNKDYVLQLAKNENKVQIIGINTNYPLNKSCKIKGKVTHVIKPL